MANQPASFPPTRTYRVGVFRRPAVRHGRWLYHAYTTWFDPSWPGCCVHIVQAVSGTEAKKQAIALCRRGCGTAEVAHGVAS